MNEKASQATTREEQSANPDSKDKGRPEELARSTHDTQRRTNDVASDDPLHVLCACIALLQFTIDDATRKLSLNDRMIKVRSENQELHDPLGTFNSVSIKISEALRTLIMQLRTGQATVFISALEDHIGKDNAARLIKHMQEHLHSDNKIRNP